MTARIIIGLSYNEGNVDDILRVIRTRTNWSKYDQIMRLEEIDTQVVVGLLRINSISGLLVESD